MSMRIGGLASGIDTDSLIKQLMTAERIPLDKMSQKKTTMEWQRDAFREVNKKLNELDEMALNMKLSTTYNSKKVSSTLPNAVTATGTSSSTNGTYKINVEKLASSAINISEAAIGPVVFADNQKISFSTFDKEGNAVLHEYEVNADETLKGLIKKINDDPDNNVRLTLDENTNKVILETTRTGNYNRNGNEIVFEENSFFTDVLKLNPAKETGGEDAKFTYNGAYTVESKDNSYTLNGITFNFNDVTGSQGATLTVNNDVDASFDKIMAFVNKYNEVIEAMNASQQEARYRDFPPLTEEQKKDMSESEIEKWEEKAKSGLLKGESAITGGMISMRQSWYSTVDTGGAFTSLTQIGITTSKDYLDGGKLVVKEEDLKKALQEDPAGVQKLFSNSSTGAERGLVNRLEDAVESTMKKINQRAGKGTDTLENYTIGKNLKNIESQIKAFEDKLKNIETRYWKQFSAMEQAISRMNNQSAMLMNNFGTGGY